MWQKARKGGCKDGKRMRKSKYNMRQRQMVGWYSVNNMKLLVIEKSNFSFRY